MKINIELIMNYYCFRMACLSKSVNSELDVDIEELYHQTTHLDPRRLLRTVDNKPIEWEPLENFVTELIWGKTLNNKHEYTALYNILKKKYKMTPSTVAINYTYKVILNQNPNSTKFPRISNIENYIKGKKQRIVSGVLVFTVLTSGKQGFKGGNGGCQWNCHYCPDVPGMPRSYVPGEPAVDRAISNDFDAFRQIWDRASVLFLQGKHIDKIEIIVEGGTIASYDKNYLRKFMRDLYYAFNTFYSSNQKRRQIRYTLEKEMMINETSLSKVIGLTLETRPDCINATEINFFREVGCTRVQIGIQHLDDKILKIINRKCYYQDTVKAILLLKDCGFKVDAHFMPDLPGSNPELDKKMFAEVLNSHHIQVDDWKIYPCQTVNHSQILYDFNDTMSQFKEFLCINEHLGIRFKDVETLIRLKPHFKTFCEINGIDHMIHHNYTKLFPVIPNLTIQHMNDLVDYHNKMTKQDENTHYSCQSSKSVDFIEQFMNMISEISNYEKYESQFTSQFLNPIDEYDDNPDYQHLIKPRFNENMSLDERISEMTRYCTNWEKQYEMFVPYLQFYHPDEQMNMRRQIKKEYLIQHPNIENKVCSNHNTLMYDFNEYLIDIGFNFYSPYNEDDEDFDTKSDDEFGELTNKELEKLFEQFCLETETEHYMPYTHDFIRCSKHFPGSNIDKLIDVCKDVKRKIWPWIRINRLVRDLPHNYIQAGLHRSDMRDVIQKQLMEEGTPCMCSRCREIKGHAPASPDKIKQVVYVYEASHGIEYYIDMEDDNRQNYGHIRLRLCCNPGSDIIPEIKNHAIIRELHIYGETTPAWDKNLKSDNHVQHQGYGKILVKEAEKIATLHGYNNIAIIAGNSVRNYYIEKLGYTRSGTYLVKSLKHKNDSSITTSSSLLDWKNQQWNIVMSLGYKIYIKPTDIELPTEVESESVITRDEYILHQITNYPICTTILMGITFLVIKKGYEYMMMNEENT